MTKERRKRPLVGYQSHKAMIHRVRHRLAGALKSRTPFDQQSQYRARLKFRLITFWYETLAGYDSACGHSFFHIKYSRSLVGNLRLRLPQPNLSYNGTHLATAFGLACLTINVITPSTATSRSKLPVVIWIYGDGGSLLGFMHATGFREGDCIISASPLDPKFQSVSLHLVANGGNNEGLFRAAVMQSGSLPQYGDITEGQPLYDTIVQETGCSGSSDTLQCLRDLPFAILKAAIDKSPVQQGIIANVPIISGDCDDEGTLFSFSTLNITYNILLRGIGVTDAEISQLATLYPSDLTQGSPYDTGVTNTLTPQFKRLASLQGDLTFQAPRRFLLQNRSGKQTVFAFLSKRFKTLPTLGSFHVTDLLNVYGGEELTNYLVRFVATLNPNGFGNVLWPQYTPQSPQMLTFLDGTIPTTPTMDTYRGPQIAFLNNLTLVHPL
ncbi:alpha/beta-hydrolase [Agrocybe pediades]|nr:alpha/beta-hydrolase [Agrocybe pediades]